MLKITSFGEIKTNNITQQIYEVKQRRKLRGKIFSILHFDEQPPVVSVIRQKDGTFKVIERTLTYSIMNKSWIKRLKSLEIE
jgi:hypothetical protein